MSELTALNEKLKAHCEEKDRKITSLTRQMDTLEGRLGETGHEVGRWKRARGRALEEVAEGGGRSEPSQGAT